jgi:hypothetical protein
MTDVCKGCGETIEWVVTKGGKRMPVNLVPVKVAVARPDGRYDVATGRESHFATCSKAGEFRKPRNNDAFTGQSCANCQAWVKPRVASAIFVRHRAFCGRECRSEWAATLLPSANGRD